mmetsp:Transcript_30515/g.74108  ORF Transcript_30515/g.74108 Transcript_30515/m.74108 type:complete len:653 (+) Transcript_30515:293-2251(+)
MFVAGLVDELIRQIDQTRRRHGHGHGHSHGRGPNSSPDGGSNGKGIETYHSFMARQKETWTPPDLFDKCCARWLAGGGGGRLFDFHDHHHHHHRYNSHDGTHQSHNNSSISSFDSLLSHSTFGSSSSSSSSSTTLPGSSNYHHCRLKNGRWTCNGGCNKLHPTITLFFDASNQKTLAVLSCRLDPFVKYFDSLVDMGVAACKTPYLYELDGYVRQNLHYMTSEQEYQQHQYRSSKERNNSSKKNNQHRPTPLFKGHLVKVAMGAIEESDAAHRDVLELEHHHRGGHICPLSNNSSQGPSNQERWSELVDDVLDVCLLNDLEEHLDVLTLHCMTRTNTKLRTVATKIIEKRLSETEIVISPFVDGCYMAGYSVFRREQALRKTIIQREHGGRMIEYAVCLPIVCKSTSNKNHSNDPAVPCCHRRNDDEKLKNNGKAMKTELSAVDSHTHDPVLLGHNKLTFRTLDDTNDRFDWDCEELSFANLERDWGDICVHEYIGQNVNIYWRRSKVDMINFQESATDTKSVSFASTASASSSTSSTTLPCDLQFFNVHLSTSKKGPVNINEFSMPHFNLKMDVEQMDATQVDEVTVRFRGKARVVGCQMDFLCLVATYARSLEPKLLRQLKKIEKTRPLLSHELEFFKYVQKASGLCHGR